MINRSAPRLDYINLTWATELMRFHQEEMQEIIHELKEEKTQIRCYMLAEEYKNLGLFNYALGYSLDKVRLYFTEAVSAYIENLSLREERKDKENTHGAASEYFDYSIGNSKSSLLMLYIALIVNNFSAARHIAELIWDPPNADYIGNDSEICTPNEQRVAYTVKYILLDNKQEASTLLSKIDLNDHLECQVNILNSLINENEKDFVDKLNKLVLFHEKWASEIDSRKVPDSFLNIPGLGICAYAISKHIVSSENISISDIHLPLNILFP